MAKLKTHVEAESLSDEDLLFALRQDSKPALPELPDPETLGRTEPNAKGRTYKHGTKTAYTLGGCKCEYCRGAFARYRAERRAAGKDEPRAEAQPPGSTTCCRRLMHRDRSPVLQPTRNARPSRMRCA
jgi:hypothetical protein